MEKGLPLVINSVRYGNFVLELLLFFRNVHRNEHIQDIAQ